MCACAVKCVRCGGASGRMRIYLFSGSLLCFIITYFCSNVHGGLWSWHVY